MMDQGALGYGTVGMFGNPMYSTDQYPVMGSQVPAFGPGMQEQWMMANTFPDRIEYSPYPAGETQVIVVSADENLQQNCYAYPPEHRASPFFNQGPTVTSLSVNHGEVHRSLHDPRVTNATKLPVDLCMRCGINPAKLTLANSRDMRVLKLCSKCHSISKDERHQEPNFCQVRRYGPDVLDVNQGRTVVKVEDKSGARSPTVCEAKLNGFKKGYKGPIVYKPPEDEPPSVLRIQGSFIMNEPLKASQEITRPEIRPVIVDQRAGNWSPILSREAPINDVPIETSRVISQSVKAGDDTAVVEAGIETISIYSDTLSNKTCKPNKIKAQKKNHSPPAASSNVRPAVVKPQTVAAMNSMISALPPQRPSVRDLIMHPISTPREYVVAPAGMITGISGHQIHLMPSDNRQSGARSSRQTVPLQPNAPEMEREPDRPLAFNPQYEDNGDTASISDLGLPTVEPRDLFPVATTKAEEAAAAERNSETDPRLFSGRSQFGTLSAPPRYEEIMNQEAVLDRKGGSSSSNQSLGNGVSLVSTFGKYGEISTQPGAFKSPTRVEVSRNGKLAVADPAHGTVQLFSGADGECLSLIKVPGISGCCELKNDSLAVSTNRGVEIYNVNGKLGKKVDMGPVSNVVSYGSGFIAVRQKDLVIFKDLADGRSRTLMDMSKMGPRRQPIPFKYISDIAVNSQNDLVVLDSGSIYTMTDEGYIKSAIHPSKLSCGPLKQPSAITVDKSHAVLVSDTGNNRILQFGANGQYQRTIYERKQGNDTASASPIGIAVSEGNKLYVVNKGPRFAEISVFGYN